MSMMNTLNRSEYVVQRSGGPVPTGCDWDTGPWQETAPLTIGLHMGDPPEHKPRTQAKLLYDDEFVHVRFRVEDRYIISAVTDHQGRVCNDSCAEFFFTPGEDLEQGYFNIELNCGGTVLFHHQLFRDTNPVDVNTELISHMEIRHSMPDRVYPERPGPETWTAGYRVPWHELEVYAPVTPPGPGAVWRANFYKCADSSSHPHWLTWSPVENEKPDFHLKQYFGLLRFA